MDEKALQKVVDDLDLDRTYENVIIGGMFAIMVVVIMAQYM